MDENEFYGKDKQTPAGARPIPLRELMDDDENVDDKDESSFGCGCLLLVLVVLLAAIVGVIWLVTGS